MKKRVAGYGRVSTQGQIEGTSLEEQKRKITERCKIEGYELVDLYFDEGISGGSLQRQQLQRMREDAKAKKFEAVLFTKLDRLGRNARDIHNIWHEFNKDMGINFICIDDPSINTEGKMGSLMVGMLASFAQFEKETIRERTTNGRRASWNNHQLPIGNHQMPYGYQKNKITRQPEIIKEQAAIYKKIVSLYLVKRMSSKEIALLFSREGVPTPSSLKREKKTAVKWSSMNILKMLKNPAYKGEGVNNKFAYTYTSGSNGKYMAASKKLRPEEQWIKTKYLPLISEERWQEIQDRISNQKTKPKRIYKGYEDHFLLDGFLYCGECGSRMRKKVKMENNGKVRLYYTCYWNGCGSKEKELANRSCYLSSVNAENVDKEIWVFRLCCA